MSVLNTSRNVISHPPAFLIHWISKRSKRKWNIFWEVREVIKFLLFILSKNSIDTLSGLSIQDRMCHRFSGGHIVSPVKFSVNSLDWGEQTTRKILKFKYLFSTFKPSQSVKLRWWLIFPSSDVEMIRLEFICLSHAILQDENSIVIIALRWRSAQLGWVPQTEMRAQYFYFHCSAC